MIKKLIPYTIIFIAGLTMGIVFLRLNNKNCENKYSFINTNIVCENEDVISKTNYSQTRENLINFIEIMQAEGKADEAAVYFRDLEHGPIFGINELSAFSPASLLKLPIAFVFMQSAETQPELLEQQIQYTGTTTTNQQRIKPLVSAEPNRFYTIGELLKLMLVYSDNASYEALDAFLSADSKRSLLRRETFQELGLINPVDRVEKTITVRGYASLFRIIYNVSFLNEELSEKMLAWLAESDYRNGLVAGVPSDIKVAHKFGERYVSDDQKQLHDCGIIYYPGNPYLLCVMTRGSDFTKLEEVIKHISRIVYEEVDSRKI